MVIRTRLACLLKQMYSRGQIYCALDASSTPWNLWMSHHRYRLYLCLHR